MFYLLQTPWSYWLCIEFCSWKMKSNWSAFLIVNKVLAKWEMFYQLPPWQILDSSSFQNHIPAALGRTGTHWQDNLSNQDYLSVEREKQNFIIVWHLINTQCLTVAMIFLLSNWPVFVLFSLNISHFGIKNIDFYEASVFCWKFVLLRLPGWAVEALLGEFRSDGHSWEGFCVDYDSHCGSVESQSFTKGFITVNRLRALF